MALRGGFRLTKSITSPQPASLGSDGLSQVGFEAPERRRDAIRVYATGMDPDLRRAACDVTAKMLEARDIPECPAIPAQQTELRNRRRRKPAR
jgi:hypothetical protein